MAEGGRYRELDALRGIAAMAVVISHLTGNFDLFFPEYPPLGVSFAYGGLGVQLFFMISGYVILMTARRYGDPSEFSRARAVRLYPTYWASLTLTVAVVFALGFEQLYRPWGEIAVNYTMLQSFVAVRDFDGAYWSLARELVFYILIGLALWRLRGELSDRFVIWFSLAWSTLGLALIVLHIAVGEGWSAILSSASVGQYAPCSAWACCSTCAPAGERSIAPRSRSPCSPS